MDEHSVPDSHEQTDDADETAHGENLLDWLALAALGGVVYVGALPVLALTGATLGGANIWEDAALVVFAGVAFFSTVAPLVGAAILACAGVVYAARWLRRRRAERESPLVAASPRSGS